MKRTGQVLPSRRMKMQNLKAAHEQRQPALRNKQGVKEDLLLRHPNFVAKSKDPSFEPPPLACEASALTTELTAPNRA
ncbi:MAG: hypothetical protein KAV68_05325 [Dehalococcoidales bacterium]|nr:hypothetical protein [Dehalococcoidales bacterium]